MLPILTDLRHARVMQSSLEDLVEEGNYCKVYFFGFSYQYHGETNKKPGNLFHIVQAFQVLSEYLQLLDSLSEFSAIQEMTRGVEVALTYS